MMGFPVNLENREVTFPGLKKKSDAAGTRNEVNGDPFGFTKTRIIVRGRSPILYLKINAGRSAQDTLDDSLTSILRRDENQPDIGK